MYGLLLFKTPVETPVEVKLKILGCTPLELCPSGGPTVSIHDGFSATDKNGVFLAVF